MTPSVSSRLRTPLTILVLVIPSTQKAQSTPPHAQGGISCSWSLGKAQRTPTAAGIVTGWDSCTFIASMWEPGTEISEHTPGK